MAFWLYARSVCDTKAPLQLQWRLVALYKCFMLLPAFALRYGFYGRILSISVSGYV